jgi:hypothetical protein
MFWQCSIVVSRHLWIDSYHCRCGILDMNSPVTQVCIPGQKPTWTKGKEWMGTRSELLVWFTTVRHLVPLWMALSLNIGWDFALLGYVCNCCWWNLEHQILILEPSCISIRNSWRWFIIQDLKLMEEQLFIEHTDLCYSNFELTILNGN